MTISRTRLNPVAQRLARRQSLATPRALPAPPLQGFDEATNPISAFEVPSPDMNTPVAAVPVSSDEEEGDGTPLVDLKKKLKAIRRQSRQSLGTAFSQGRAIERSLTIGLAEPSTPQARHAPRPQISASAAPAARYTVQTKVATPATAHAVEQEIVEARDDWSQASDEEPQAVECGATESVGEDTREPELGTPSGYSINGVVHASAQVMAKSPSCGVRETQQAVEPMSNPAFSGLREMLGPAKDQPATPDLRHLKHMMPQTNTVLATPAMFGLRHLFASQPNMASPVMEGLGEMFEQDSPGPAKAPGKASTAPIAGSSPNRAIKAIKASASKTAAPSAIPAPVAAAPTRVRRTAAAVTSQTAPLVPRVTRTRAAPKPPFSGARVTKQEVAEDLTSEASAVEPAQTEMESSTSSVPARRLRTGRSAEPVPPASAVAKRPARGASAKAATTDAAPPPKARARATSAADAAEPAVKPTRASRAAPSRPKAEPLQEIVEQEHEAAPVAPVKSRVRATAVGKASAVEEPSSKAAPRPARATKASVSKAAAVTASAAAAEKEPPAAAAVKIATRTTATTRARAKPVANAPAEPDAPPKRVTRARK